MTTVNASNFVLLCSQQTTFLLWTRNQHRYVCAKDEAAIVIKQHINVKIIDTLAPLVQRIDRAIGFDQDPKLRIAIQNTVQKRSADVQYHETVRICKIVKECQGKHRGDINQITQKTMSGMISVLSCTIYHCGAQFESCCATLWLEANIVQEYFYLTSETFPSKLST